MTDAQRELYMKTDCRSQTLSEVRKKTGVMFAAHHQQVVKSLKGIVASQNNIQKNQHIMNRNMFTLHKQTSSSLSNVQSNVQAVQSRVLSHQNERFDEAQAETASVKEQLHEMKSMLAKVMSKQNNPSQYHDHDHHHQFRPQLPSSGDGSFHHLQDPWTSSSPGESEPSLPPVHLYDSDYFEDFAADFRQR